MNWQRARLKETAGGAEGKRGEERRTDVSTNDSDSYLITDELG